MCVLGSVSSALLASPRLCSQPDYYSWLGSGRRLRIPIPTDCLVRYCVDYVAQVTRSGGVITSKEQLLAYINSPKEQPLAATTWGCQVPRLQLGHANILAESRELHKSGLPDSDCQQGEGDQGQVPSATLVRISATTRTYTPSRPPSPRTVARSTLQWPPFLARRCTGVMRTSRVVRRMTKSHS